MRLQIAFSLLVLAFNGYAQTPTNSTEMKIDPSTQKQRDNGRLQILNDEMKSEQEALAKAQKQLQEAQVTRQADKTKEFSESVARHQANIDALNKEITRMANQPVTPTHASTTDVTAPRTAKPINHAERNQQWLIIGQPEPSLPSPVVDEDKEKAALVRVNAIEKKRRPLGGEAKSSNASNTPDWIIIQK